MRLIGKQQFDISTPFSRRLMSTVAFMVILRSENKQQKRQKQRDCFFLWLLGFCAILFDEEQTQYHDAYDLHLLEYVYVLYINI